MVGFGSSLRMARRSGWEQAYLDYETLKLMLSQIEAVYEEEGLKFYNQQNLDKKEERGAEFSDGSGLLTTKEKSLGANRSHDYRHDLFLENDSNAAYGSLDYDDYDLDDFCEEDESEAEGLQHSYFYDGRPLQQRKATDKRFPLPYNLTNSSPPLLLGREGDSKNLSVSRCFGCCLQPRKKDTKAKTLLKKRTLRPTQISDIYYSDADNRSPSARNEQMESQSFFLTRDEEDAAISIPSTDAAGRTIERGPSLLYPPAVKGFFVNESTMLLNSPQFQLPRDDQDVSAPLTNSNGTSFPENSPYFDLNSFVNKSETPYNSFKSPSQDVLKRRYEPEKRKTSRRKQRKTRKNRAPRHIRTAHAKASAIMERFLGLLRAETEKVLLFAHSRLGELADTVGTLRFPSLDEEYGSINGTTMINDQTNEKDRRKKNGSYYPFADGGIHPSGSSSSDEGGIAWSEDNGSEDDKESLPTSRLATNHRMKSPTKQHQSQYSEDLEDPYARSNAGSNRIDANNRFYRKRDPLDGVRRQLAHFAELRKCRSVFRRNDQILGEDMLFLSAVEEAEGYTLVGVELMHVLKYIDVNLLAVRKICRKHDRLLMQRMVGFYYKKIQSRDGFPYDRHWHSDDAKTLGGLVARVSGEVYEVHPALIGQMHHFKLVGVYDTKIQNLAKSRSVDVVSSCLALALSEFEVARSRASALNKLNSKSVTKTNNGTGTGGAIENIGVINEQNSEANGSEGPPSTASIVLLTRLRFTVVSIFALREAARYKTDTFMAYLSRSMLTFTGSQVIGEGLDGCSRATLNFLMAYNPDAVLLFDASMLFDGIKGDQWTRLPMDEVMISTLAVATTSRNLPNSNMSIKEELVANAVSVVPESKSVMLKRLIRGQFPRRLTGRRILAADDVPKMALVLNRMSCFLYMMNYYVYHATTLLLVESEGYPAGFSGMIIGVPNMSAIIITFVHCYAETQEVDILPYRYSVSTMRSLFLFSALMAATGNAVHAVSIIRNSVPLAILGRFIFGFSSVELLNRHLIAACMPSHFVTESARLMLFRVCGAAWGLLMGSAVVAIPKCAKMLNEKTLQAASWIMTFFWIVQFIRILSHFRPRSQIKRSNSENDVGVDANERPIDESESSSSEIHTPSTVLYRKSTGLGSDSNQSNGMDDDINQSKASTFGSELDLNDSLRGHNAFAKKNNAKRRAHISQVKFLSRMYKFLLFHLAVPTTLVTIAFTTYATEILFTAAPIVTEEYFGWSSAHASTYLGCVTCLALPIHFLCELVVRRYEDRIVIKRSFAFIVLSTFFMLNWRSLYLLAHQVKEIFTDVIDRRTSSYDWWVGKAQFCVGIVGLFAGLVALEGASLSLLSKVSPANNYSKSVALNVGTIVSLLGFVSRLFADINILVIDMSQKLINADMINSLLIPILLCSLVGYFVIAKYFFFLV